MSMEEQAVRRSTAASGLVAGVAVMVSVPLYFTHDGPPPAYNVLTRDLISLFTCAGLLVFVAGFSHLAGRRSPAAGFPASVASAAGFIFVAIALVTISLEAGVVFGAPDGSLDPTIDGPLAHANMLAHGPIKRLLSAIYLVAAAHAALLAGLLPRWLRRAGYVVALINLAFVPSLYFGTDPTDFYAVHSWANSALGASLFIYWIIAASIALLLPLRGTHPAEAAALRARSTSSG
jgi:hypothetical protein